jgi:hypothetical protein
VGCCNAARESGSRDNPRARRLSSLATGSRLEPVEVIRQHMDYDNKVFKLLKTLLFHRSAFDKSETQRWCAFYLRRPHGDSKDKCNRRVDLIQRRVRCPVAVGITGTVRRALTISKQVVVRPAIRRHGSCTCSPADRRGCSRYFSPRLDCQRQTPLHASTAESSIQLALV